MNYRGVKTSMAAEFTVYCKRTGVILAQGISGRTVRIFEDHLYFKPEVVRRNHLRETSRTYTCPYKGICYWIDVLAADGSVLMPNAAWVYHEPYPNYSFISDEIAFYWRPTSGTWVEEREIA